MFSKTENHKLDKFFKRNSLDFTKNNLLKYFLASIKMRENSKFIFTRALSDLIEILKKIIDHSKTVLWNGPAGYYENENFLIGTMSVAESISKNTVENSLISILGGGDTLAAIKQSKNKLFFTHLSTAGGAFLEYLEGKDLPGLSVLK